MFLVGAEFKNGAVSQPNPKRSRSFDFRMLVPFALGAGLAAIFVKVPGLFSEKATLTEAILFLGAAMSINGVSDAGADYLMSAD